MRTLLLGSLFVTIGAFAQAPRFTIQDLGSLTDLPYCRATAISQSGNVVGYCLPDANLSLLGATGSPPVDAFLYTNGAMQDLNLATFQTPVPTAVNDSGVVTGAYLDINFTDGTSANPFVVQSDGTSQLLEGKLEGLLPLGLNDSGQIIGTQLNIASGFDFVLYSRALLTTVAGAGASPTILPPAPGIFGTPTAIAFGLSQANNWIAGATVGPGTFVQAMLWKNQVPQLLPVLSQNGVPIYSQSLATAVNDSGMASGVAFDMDLDSTTNPVPGALAHAVLYSNATVTDLGTLEGDKSSIALGINNSGWVVGFSDNRPPPLGLSLAPLLAASKPGYHAFLYANGTMYNLGQLIPATSGWQLVWATQINNAGQIVGTGIYQGQERAFLLTPVAAPAPPQINSVVGAANSVPPVTGISTDSLFTLYGTSFADQSVSRAVTTSDLLNNGTALPTNLANTCVESNGTRWPVLYVSATQINALAPGVPTSGTLPVSVIANCDTGNDVTSAAVNVNVAASTPEFLYFVANQDGQNPVAAIENATGAYVGTPSLLSGATFAPARPGDVLAAFGVGWGATESTDPIGTLATAAANVIGNYSLTVGGQDAKVLYVGLTPGFAGLYQVDFVVPALPAGSGTGLFNQALVLTVNGVTTPTGGYITVMP